MDSARVFVILVVLMLAIALFSTLYAKRFTVEYWTFRPPYAEALGAYAFDGRLYVTIAIKNETYPVNVTGGYVEIVNTGQYANITPTHNNTFNVSFPLTYSLVTLATVAVEGVIKGTMEGNPVYITFSSVVPVKLSFDVRVVKFTYNDSTANVTLYVFNPVNVTLLYIRGLSLTNANLSEAVAGLDFLELNLSLPAGVHYVNLTVDFAKEGGVVYEQNVLPGYAYYISGELEVLEDFQQPRNASFQLYKIELFS